MRSLPRAEAGLYSRPELRMGPSCVLLAGLLALSAPAYAQEPPGPEATFQHGVAALKEGRLADAEKDFRRVLEQGLAAPYVHNNLAIVYQQQGRHREAVTECREALRLDPAYSAPRAVMGGSLLALGRTTEAIAELEVAVKRLPRERLAREQLARAYERAGRPIAAIDQYRALRDAAPADPEPAYEVGRAYLRLSEWAMERLSLLDAGSARLHQLLGHNYRVQGRADLAVREFERAAAADPKLPEVHLALAQIHLASRNLEAARREVEQELAIVPESAGALALARTIEAAPPP